MVSFLAIAFAGQPLTVYGDGRRRVTCSSATWRGNVAAGPRDPASGPSADVRAYNIGTSRERRCSMPKRCSGRRRRTCRSRGSARAAEQMRSVVSRQGGASWVGVRSAAGDGLRRRSRSSPTKSGGAMMLSRACSRVARCHPPARAHYHGERHHPGRARLPSPAVGDQLVDRVREVDRAAARVGHGRPLRTRVRAGAQPVDGAHRQGERRILRARVRTRDCSSPKRRPRSAAPSRGRLSAAQVEALRQVMDSQTDTERDAPVASCRERTIGSVSPSSAC